MHGVIIYRYTVGQSAPLLDIQSNIFDTSAEFENGLLTMRFSREMVATDTIHDVSINETRYWIWAMGEVLNGIYTQHYVQGEFLYTLPSAELCPSGTKLTSSDQMQQMLNSTYETNTAIVLKILPCQSCSHFRLYFLIPIFNISFHLIYGKTRIVIWIACNIKQ